MADDLNNHVTNSHFWHKISKLTHIFHNFSLVRSTNWAWEIYYFRVVTDLYTYTFPNVPHMHAPKRLDSNWLKSNAKVHKSPVEEHIMRQSF